MQAMIDSGRVTERTYTSHVLLDRLGEPHEIAAVTAFLPSAEASYISGTTDPVDGGWAGAGLRAYAE